MPKKKSVTTHRAQELFDMSNPRDKEHRKTYKRFFNNNQEAYEDFLLAWDEAKRKGSRYTFSVAMVIFRQQWTDETGEWERKLPDGSQIDSEEE